MGVHHGREERGALLLEEAVAAEPFAPICPEGDARQSQAENADLRGTRPPRDDET